MVLTASELADGPPLIRGPVGHQDIVDVSTILYYNVIQEV